MSIKVKFFASLKDRVGRSEAIVESTEAMKVEEIWARTAGRCTMPPNTLVAINMEYASVERTVQDGDEIAFFPPVTGG